MDTRPLLLLIALLYASTLTSSGSIIATITENGSDVILDYEGTLDLSALSGPGSASINAGLHEPPSGAYFGGTSLSAFSIDAYTGIAGPSTFFSSDSAAFVDADAAGGDFFGIIAGGSVTSPGIYVDSGYISGNVIAGDATVASSTLASLNLVEGIYTWNWGSGANASSVELTIGNPIPEARQYAAFAAIIASLCLVWRKRRAFA